MIEKILQVLILALAVLWVVTKIVEVDSTSRHCSEYQDFYIWVGNNHQDVFKKYFEQRAEEE